MKILLIEDEMDIAAFVQKGLEEDYHTVDYVSDGKKALDLAVFNDYDLVITDLNLPNVGGREIIERIRKNKKNTLVIVLTVDTDIDHKADLLSACDDYITKPFSMKELLARVRAVGRRGPITRPDFLQIADLCLDLRNFKVTRAGREIDLRNKEFCLLEYLMRNAGAVISRAMILEHVWDMHTDPFTNTVDVHVRFLRKKIDGSHRKKLIRTIPKRGYKIEA